LRENVLTGVLLHMIQPPQPIYAAFYNRSTCGCRALNNMQHAIITIVDTLNDSRAIEGAGVAWLTAARRIERRLIEDHCRPATDAFSDIDDASFKLD
jgi:hypothetical protein